MTPSDGETAGRAKAWLAFAFFFCVIAGYYWIKPVRDAVFLHRKTFEALPAYHLVVAGAGLALVYVYNAAANILSRRALLMGVYGSFLLMTSACAVRLREGTAGPAAFFFVELSLFNFLLVGVFWTVVNDVFSVAEGRRWYAWVGLAGPLGALSGSLGAAALAEAVGPVNLIWVSLPFFTAALAAGLRLDAVGRRHPPPAPPRVAAEAASLDVGLVLRSRYALLLAGLVTSGVFVATLYAFDFQRLLQDFALTEGEKTVWLAKRMWMENGLGLLVQAFATPPLLRQRGLEGALWVLPLVMGVGGVVLAAHETLPVAAGLVVLSGGIGYTLNQSAKELLYVPCDRPLKYKAKAVIDVFGARLGGAAAAVLVLGGRALFGGASFQPFLILAAGACVAWLGFARSAGASFRDAVRGRRAMPPPGR